MPRGVFYCCRLVKKKTVHNVAFFFAPETEPFMKARFIQTINLQGLQKLSTRKTLMSTDRKNCYFLWFLVLTRWIFLSTCGLGKFQIPSNFAESSWSSGCGLNLCHHTNYIFTQPKKQQERKNFLRNKIQLTKIDLTWTKNSLFSVHLFSV